MNVAWISRMLLPTLLAAGALGYLARAPWHFGDADAALLRLSWRLRGEREERCRARSAEELEALPVHMRTPEVCETHLLSYRLVLQLDEGAPDTLHIRPAGARGDRPLFVLHDTTLEPGPHRVRIRLGRADGQGRELSLDEQLEARPGAIELITLDAAADRLVRRSGPSR